MALCEGEISGIGRVWADGARDRLARRSRTASISAARRRSRTASSRRARARTTRRPIAAWPTSCSSAWRWPTSATALPQLSFEVYRAVEPFGEADPRRRADPRLGRVRLRADAGDARARAAAARESENVHTRQGGTDWAVVDRPARGDAAQRQVGLAGRELVRHRPARRRTASSSPASRPTTKTTSPVDVEAWRASSARRRLRRQPARRARRPMAARRPTRRVDRCDPRSERARLRRDADAVHPHGRAGRQRAARSLRRQRRSRPIPGAGASPCDPAPGEPGTPDKTAAAATQIAAFVGTAAPGDFALVGDAVVYSGPDEWSLPAHGAALCASRQGGRRRRRRSSSARSCAG